MTHLGLVSASAVAARGFATLCYDGDAKLIARLDAGDRPMLEPGLDELIRGNAGRQTFTARLDDLARCDVVYIALDVATDDEGRSDATALRALIERVAGALGPNALLVILSQVQPGFTRSLDAPPRERLYYQVETLVFGRAVERAMKPERYIVGCAEPGRPIDARLAAVLKAFECPILPMRYESAELAKIAINCCLVASISVANTLGELCERMGADWAEIAPALKLDRRIGPYSYLTPGLGIAGGNLERDLATVMRMADERGTDAGLVRAWRRNSQYRRDWPLRVLHRTVMAESAEPAIGILGVTYKEDTHSIKNSPSVALIRRLRGARLRVFDPAVAASPEWHPGLVTTADMDSVCDGVDALAIMTPWALFRSLDIAAAAQRMRGRIVVDPFAVLDRERVAAAGLDHFVLGVPPLKSRTIEC
jgi:UDPglucose 6-dehydrogenase